MRGALRAMPSYSAAVCPPGRPKTWVVPYRASVSATKSPMCAISCPTPRRRRSVRLSPPSDLSLLRYSPFLKGCPPETGSGTPQVSLLDGRHEGVGGVHHIAHVEAA